MGLVRTIAPTALPVTLPEVKKQLEIWSEEKAHDSQLRFLIEAAAEHAEGITGRALLDQTYVLTLDTFPLYDESDRPSRSIMLPRPPLQSISSIEYVDCDGVLQTLDSSQYQTSMHSTPGLVAPLYGETWPEARRQIEAVKITYVAGYGSNSSSVPAKIRQAILMLVAHWFENREAVKTGTITKPIEMATMSLLKQLRVGTNHFGTYGVTR